VLRATEYVVPALEILSSRIEMQGRTIVDTISDNAAMGGMVYGGNPVPIGEVDLRWVSALLYRNETIEESGEWRFVAERKQSYDLTEKRYAIEPAPTMPRLG